MKKQDILENRAEIAYLSLGSNLGNRILNLEKAKFLLYINNVEIVKISNYYETDSWPNKKFPKYLNNVIKVNTFLKPLSLLKLTKSIEKKIGRKKTHKNFPRVCDIDILDYSGLNTSINSNIERLEIPHPRLHKRNFVLIPLSEISKNWVHPFYKQKISQLLSNISNKDLRTIKII